MRTLGGVAAAWVLSACAAAVFVQPALATPCRVVFEQATSQGVARDIGSGTLIDKVGTFGVVLTCSHVVVDAPGYVIWPNKGRSAIRQVIRDKGDLALLLVEGVLPEPRPVGEFSGRGEFILEGFGPPSGIGLRRVTAQAIGRSRAQGEPYDSGVFDAGVRQGDSGGGVLAGGRVVGVIWGSEGGRAYATTGRPVIDFIRRAIYKLKFCGPGGCVQYRPSALIVQIINGNAPTPAQPQPQPPPAPQPDTGDTQQFAEALAAVQAELSAALSALAEVREELARLKDNLPAGGPDADALKGELQQYIDAAVSRQVIASLDHPTPIRVWNQNGTLAGESSTNIFREGSIDFTFVPRSEL